MARYLRMTRAWACYHLFMWWPLRWNHTRPALAILPYAGDWSYADDVRAMGLDPWGPRPFFSEDEDRATAALAHAEIQAALNKAGQP